MKIVKKSIKYLTAAGLLGISIAGTAGIKEPNYTAYADEVTVITLTAYYTGGSVIVGDDLNSNNIKVYAYYSDGKFEEVTSYTMNSKTVTTEGTNYFAVSYGGKTASLSVTGINIHTLEVQYVGPSLSVGNSISEKDVRVSARYSNGVTRTITEDLEFSGKEITAVGRNTVYVTYKGLTASFTVTGKAEKAVKALTATYVGGGQTVGMNVKTDYLTVTAIFNDGTTEKINNYVLTPNKIENLDSNTITVSFKGQKATFIVMGIEKNATSIKAEYSGAKVVVGKYARKKNITVKAVYADGAEEILAETDYTLRKNGKVTAEGDNIITIDYKDLNTTITVTGVLSAAPDFTNAPLYTVSNGLRTAKLKVDIPDGYFQTDFAVKSIEKSLVKRCLSKEVKEGDYIPFAVRYEHEDLDEERPLQMQIDLPWPYKPEGLSFWYTPNRKTVIGKMSFEIVDSDTIQVSLYNEGTYILAYDPKWKEKQELEDEEQYDPWW